MKKLVLSITAITIALCADAQTWTAALTTGTTENLRGVCMTSATNAHACGFNSTIAKTTDGGQNWTATAFPGGFNLFSVDFASATTGLVVGDNGLSPGGPVNCAVIKRTTDGGNSWTDIAAPDTGNYWLRSVAFADANTAIAVGSGGTVIRSTDGGASWTSVTSPATQMLWDVSFPTATTGYAVESYYNGSAYTTSVIKTTDGGLSWTATGSSLAGLTYALSFTSDTEGWLAVSNAIYGTTDGGASWTQLCSNTGIQSNDIQFLSAGNGWIGGSFMAVRNSTDGGISWATETSGSGGYINGLSFINNTTGLAVGDGGAIFRYTPPAIGFKAPHSLSPAFKAFPNPAHDQIQFESQQASDGLVQLTDLTGKIILSHSIHNGKEQLDVSALYPGIYFLKFTTGTGTYVQRLIKE